MSLYTTEDLKTMQAWSLERKIQVTQTRIIEWIQHWGAETVAVSFSGGKDSTVLADLTARIWKALNIKEPLELVFVDTGLEYPEIKKFVKYYPKELNEKHGIETKLTILRPKMNFREVIEKYGYPVISKETSCTIYEAKNTMNRKTWDGKKTAKIKQLEGTYCSSPKFNHKKYAYLLNAPFNISDRCCRIMKKQPFYSYNKHYLVATMACESLLRKTHWMRTGCNAFEGKHPQSKPMSFWTGQDVLMYLKKYNVSYASVYGNIIPVNGQESLFDDCKLCTTGCERTGCIYCGYGAHLEKHPNRFERLKITHPKQYEFCMGGGHYNEKGIIVPDKNGLGLGMVLDWLKISY